MRFVTVHETGNTSRGADARAHGSYLRGDTAAGLPVSWHYTVDSDEIRQHIPENETAFHAGDGANGTGNAQSIGIEICTNSDGDFAAAVNRAVRLVADICARRNIPPENIVQHNRWSPNNKNCPRNIRAGQPISWTEFVTRVRVLLEVPAAASPASLPPLPTPPPAPAPASAMYRVVAGSFANRANAEAQVRRLKLKGIASFITEFRQN
jgi:N-acetyl-anhydromuramyl-L-alanine amidase AmpD